VKEWKLQLLSFAFVLYKPVGVDVDVAEKSPNPFLVPQQREWVSLP
jgi:hypothetical protein